MQVNNLFVVSRLFWGLVAVNFVIVLLGAALYPEPFSLLMDPMSWLGKWVTASGRANTGLFLVTAATLVGDAVAWRYVVALADFPWMQRREMRLFGAMVSLGFVIMAFPCDIFVATHSFGAGIMVGGLWAFTAMNLYHLYRYGIMGATLHRWLHIVLHAAALFCGVNFVLDTPLKGFSQRPLILAILADNFIFFRLLKNQQSGISA